MKFTEDIHILSGHFDRNEITYQAFIEGCCRVIAGTIGCSRAGIWLFGEDQMTLHCAGIFDTNKNRMTMAPDETSQQVRQYFEALVHEGHVLAVDAHSNPATAGFFAERLAANSIRSLMASSFNLNGKVFGAFTCTQVNEIMNWHPAQLAKLKRIGSRVSLALAGASKTAFDTYPAPL